LKNFKITEKSGLGCHRATMWSDLQVSID